MKKEKKVISSGEKESKGISRREFIKDSGLLVGGAALGSVALMSTSAVTAAPSPAGSQPSSPATVTLTSTPPKSGYIAWDATKCVACSRCMQACSTYHEGGTNPVLSGIKWFYNKWFDGWDGEVPAYPFFCQQCDGPECYYACPYKDSALCIDATTGARYIDKSKCVGCGLCAQACNLSPSRINMDPRQKKAIKCDLCKDRPGGPACIFVCDRQALTLVAKEARI